MPYKRYNAFVLIPLKGLLRKGFKTFLQIFDSFLEYGYPLFKILYFLFKDFPYRYLLIKFFNNFPRTLLKSIEALINSIETVLNSIKVLLHPFHALFYRIILCLKPLKSLINLIKMLKDILKFLIMFIKSLLDSIKPWLKYFSIKLI